MKKRCHTRSGFTLLEVIATLVVAAIAASVLIPLLGRVFARNYETRVQYREIADLQSAMESLVTRGTNSLAVLSAHVGAEGGTYAGRYTVVQNRYVQFSGGAEASATNTALLKITLQNSLGETVTRLFAESL
jgi:prepilin-type N-terminal cleavage/methylation domain-containing protein